MGLFDKVKKAFDTGGIKTELHAPDAFRWQDETLPVSVRLTGHKSEPRTITSTEIRLRDAERDDGSRSAKERERDGIRFEYRETVVLQPGQTIALDIDFPLTASEVIDQVGATGRCQDGCRPPPRSSTRPRARVPTPRITSFPRPRRSRARRSTAACRGGSDRSAAGISSSAPADDRDG